MPFNAWCTHCNSHIGKVQPACNQVHSLQIIVLFDPASSSSTSATYIITHIACMSSSYIMPLCSHQPAHELNCPLPLALHLSSCLLQGVRYNAEKSCVGKVSTEPFPCSINHELQPSAPNLQPSSWNSKFQTLNPKFWVHHVKLHFSTSAPEYFGSGVDCLHMSHVTTLSSRWFQYERHELWRRNDNWNWSPE